VYYSTAYNAAILTRNGVTTSINSDDGELMRHLYHEAAKTQKYGGLTDNEALALITINPAKQLGIEDRVGSIEISKEADLVIFKNHPLSIYTVPMFTIVDGVLRFDYQKDPDDMRLYIDPKLDADMGMGENENNQHGCMADAVDSFESLFYETND
jgi:imidazolonepropionase-like amidohydrolase